MSEDLDFPTKEDALRDMFSFVILLYNKFIQMRTNLFSFLSPYSLREYLQTGTIIFERLYTYRKSLYQLFLPFPQ